MLKQRDDKSAAAANQSTIDMNVESSTIIMTALPNTAFMIIRVVNHWIRNLLKYHTDRDTYIDAKWNIMWNESYPYMRSSRRSLHEIYRTLTRNYSISVNDVTVYMLVEHIKANIPNFVSHYDIKEFDDNKNDLNHFQFTMNLYHDPESQNLNPYHELSSTINQTFVPFNEVHSIMSHGKTNSSASRMSQSISSKIDEDVPLEVTVHDDTDVHESVENEPETSKSTGISLSPNILPAQALGYDSTARSNRNRKKTEDLRTLVSQTCKQEIKSEMTSLRSEISGAIAENFAKLTDKMHVPSKISPHMTSITETTTTAPSTYRKNMPSPRVQPSSSNTFNKQRNNLVDNSNSADVQNTTTETQSYRPYQRSGVLNFDYEGASYELRDGVFNKESANLMEVKSDEDLIQYYQQMQSMVIMYNIFLQEFALLQPWQKSANTIPSTCIFTELDISNNTIDAYRRMKTALYIKLTKSTFHNSEHVAIVEHGAIDQDGFEILYDLMTHCHPRLMHATLKYRKVNSKPVYSSKDSIYSYCTRLQNWLEIERINNHHYSNDDLLNMVIEQLRDDTRFDIAVASIQSELTMRDMMIRQVGETPFPENLLLRNLPATIMSYYSSTDKDQLFPATNTSAVSHQLQRLKVEDKQAIVNRFQANPLQRAPVDKFCQGCGQFGHSVFHNGCDFCAKFLLASEFLKKHPNAAEDIKSDYRKHQKLRQEQRRTAGPRKSKPYTTPPRKGHSYDTRSKAKVRVLVDALNEVISVQDESSTSGEEFEDANDAEEQCSDEQSNSNKE
jgi:hypothetical protein